jgi:glycosyltransferase involved in cell wall biosynthesis
MANYLSPDISIITCSFNQKSFLETTIRSVITQSDVRLEYLVVDGLSTDGSQEIIKKYESHLSYWVSEPDGGQTQALNKGLSRATGEIVGWLCSDDVLLPGALHQIVDLFRKNPNLDAVYGDAVLINADGITIRPKREIDFFPWILGNDHNYIPQPAMFWRRSLHSKLGFLREDLHLTMDLELWLRFAKAKCVVRHVDVYLAAMRCHDSQKVVTQQDALREENEKLRLEYLSPPRFLSVLKLNRWAARGLRIYLKLLRGGYWQSQPSSVDAALRHLHNHSGTKK